MAEIPDKIESAVKIAQELIKYDSPQDVIDIYLNLLASFFVFNTKDGHTTDAVNEFCNVLRKRVEEAEKTGIKKVADDITKGIADVLKNKIGVLSKKNISDLLKEDNPFNTGNFRNN